ncbi:MAG TPA: hypothetical protein VHB30_09185 [Solirubrobacteraceae bacterium]|jgi:hypothetical protein|nr:hypothetical protein [Solirubrobacteraceae bacterium]
MRARTYVIATGIVAALVAAPLAFATGEGNPVKGGTRSPTANPSDAYTKETQIISNVATYGTRQSNKSATGGGAIYGCRSAAVGGANHPCVRASNLSKGEAFQFATEGTQGGTITVGGGGDVAKPFVTNATGVATGLNADRVDSKNADQLTADAVAAVNARHPFAQMAADGLRGASRGLAPAASARTGTGTYYVAFTGDLSLCALSATIVGNTPGLITATPAVSADKSVTTVGVATYSVAGVAADRAFHLIAYC